MSPPNRPLRVELIGLPGAGKSTLVEEVIARLSRRGLRCAEREGREAELAEGFRAEARWKRALRWLRFLVGQRRLGAHLFLYSLGFWPPKALGVRQVYVLFQALRNQLLHEEKLSEQEREREQGADVILLDQGLFHGIWCIAYLRPGPPDARLAAALRLLPAPDLAIVVEVDGAVSIRRMEERKRHIGPTGEIDRMPNLRPEQLDISGAHCRQIVDVAAEIGLSEALHLDGTRPPEELAQEVEERILALLSRDPRSREGQSRGEGPPTTPNN